VDEQRIGELTSMLHLMNPTAKILWACYGQLPLEEMLHTERFSEEWASEHQNWLVAERGDEESEADEFGFGTFVFQARRPFHAARLMNLVESSEFDQVVRSKGVVWLATRHDQAGEWSQAGKVFSLQPAGLWLSAVDAEEWPDDPELLHEIRELWEEPFGDRRIELVIIGRHLDTAVLQGKLDECLLSDEELACGPSVWQIWEDP